LEPCEALEELWASNCHLQSFEEIEQVLADKKNLTTVYFEGNPLQKKSPALYRNKVRLALKQVKQIDASMYLHVIFYTQEKLIIVRVAFVRLE